MKRESETENLAERLRNRHRDKRMGVAKRKVLLLLFGGLALGLSGSPRTSWKIVSGMTKEWNELSKQSAERAIKSLYESKLVDFKENSDGSLTLVLNDEGKRKALTYDLVHMKIRRPKVWDHLWRLVAFDVPVGKKEVRDSLRAQLLRMGFLEFQQSLFIHPYDCLEEVEYVVELHDARKFVRYMLVTNIDNEFQFKKHFSLA